MSELGKKFKHVLKTTEWKKLSLVVAAGLVLGMITIQLMYPVHKTMIDARVDDVAIGGMLQDEAKQKIKNHFEKKQLAIYFGDVDEPQQTPDLAELGVKVSSSDSVASVLYPWWLRLVPTSLWWGHSVVDALSSQVIVSEDEVDSYAKSKLGDSCEVEPENASVKFDENQLVLVHSQTGGHCEIEDVVDSIDKADFFADNPRVDIALQAIEPDITDQEANKLIKQIEKKLSGGINLVFGDKNYSLKADNVRSWLKFDSSRDKIKVSVDKKQAGKVIKDKVADAVYQAPGTVTIKTHDFQEVSRSGGGEGRVINPDKTVDNLHDFLLGKDDEIVVATSKIKPHMKYIRSYSSTDTGLSALMKNFAHDHKGAYGVSFVELSGKRRRASFNAGKSFYPASTYKLFVAYSVLKRIESGEMKWNQEVVGGRDLETCFDDMLVLSDNPCPEAIMRKINYRALNQDLSSLGLSHSKFIGSMKHQTTAGDLAIFMASLESGQMSISKKHQKKLISALKRNVHRNGIPTGASGNVADKPGFINGLLHDAAIVYSPSGTYVLAIMTDGSSWGDIAELTRQIEKLR